MTFREALNWGKEQLKKAGIAEYDLDAWLLMEYVSGISRAMYYVKDRKEMTDECRMRYEDVIRLRMSRIPLQHITGVQEFMGYEFRVNEHVLIPRQDTEILVEEADRAAREAGYSRILDLCTGSGCILLSLLKMEEHRSGTGSDLSEPALETAEENRKLLGISGERAVFQKSDLFENIEGTYDMIVSNPPYIRTEEIRGCSIRTRHWTERKTACIFTERSSKKPADIYGIRECCCLKLDAIRRKRSAGF